jgi:hypothetical protein
LFFVFLNYGVSLSYPRTSLIKTAFDRAERRFIKKHLPNNAADGNGEIVAQQLPFVYATGCFGLLERERIIEKEN